MASTRRPSPSMTIPMAAAVTPRSAVGCRRIRHSLLRALVRGELSAASNTIISRLARAAAAPSDALNSSLFEQCRCVVADGCLLLLLLLAGRKAATDDELEAVPDEWLDLAPYPLRDMQARAFVAMAGGGDLVVNAATGSGKGLLPCGALDPFPIALTLLVPPARALPPRLRQASHYGRSWDCPTTRRTHRARLLAAPALSVRLPVAPVLPRRVSQQRGCRRSSHSSSPGGASKKALRAVCQVYICRRCVVTL